MMKINFEIFDNLNNWKNRRKLTLFRSKRQLDNFQNHLLKKVFENSNESIILTSSGTSSNRPKEYKFPKKFYNTIENHHIWRIMNSHKIKNGNAIKIFQGSYNNSTNNFIGPQKIPSMGLMNDCWELTYNPKESDENFWKKQIEFIKKIRPCFLYTSPSVFLDLYSYFHSKNLNFEFPVIFSCETLTDSTRQKANLIFKTSIDKMRDWTTGFGFFECSHKTKHIYDELCYVKQNNKKEINCIDFFNYYDRIEKISDDNGTINQKMCNCGIFGNFLANFEGKNFECLVSQKGIKYSANYVSNALSSLPTDLFEYEIIQSKEKNIEFRTKNKLEDSDAMKVVTIINRIIGDDEKYFSALNDGKVINVGNSNFLIKFIVKNSTIYKNKKISLRSYAN